MKNQRNLVVAASGYSTRIETFDGREHLVVPVVALVECVMFAMNATNPELVTAEEFSRAPAGWNGRPVFEGHPLVDGKPVSGNVPDVLETQRIGIVFNAGIKKNKLVMEAWLDIEACRERAPELLARVEAGDDIEISVGVFVDKDDSQGTFAGKQYKGAWKDIVPDHLALLVEGDEGACSRQTGCGVRAAKGVAVAEKKPSLVTRVLNMFRASQPADQMSNRDLEDELREELRVVEPTLDYLVAWLPATNPNRVVYSVYVPGISPDYISGYRMFQRAFTLDANGEVSVDAARVEVEPVISYEPVLMNEDEPEDDDGAAIVDAAGKRNSSKDQQTIQDMHDHSVALGANCAPTAAANKPVGASGASAVVTPPEPVNKETENMEVKDVVAFLANATDCDKNALRAALGVEKPAAAKIPTFGELLEAADPTVRAAINEGVRVAGERKASTIKALKDSGRCKFSDEQLGAMDQAQLDNLAALAQVQAPVDFSAQAPRAATEQEVPDAPSLEDAIRASRKK